MKALLLAALLPLCACATIDPVKLAEAANALDPECAKHFEVHVTPMMLLGWVVPVVSAEYVKDCKGTQDVPVR